MNDNMRKFIRGLMVSTVSKGVLPKNGEPVAYLYNGVRLPDIPDYTYPYMYIGYNGTNWYFYCTPTKTAVGTEGYTAFITAKRYIARDGEWVAGNYVVSAKIIWSNYDVYYKDDLEEVGGTLYLAASDPIPVYE